MKGLFDHTVLLSEELFEFLASYLVVVGGENDPVDKPAREGLQSVSDQGLAVQKPHVLCAMKFRRRPTYSRNSARSVHSTSIRLRPSIFCGLEPSLPLKTRPESSRSEPSALRAYVLAICGLPSPIFLTFHPWCSCRGYTRRRPCRISPVQKSVHERAAPQL